MQHLEDNKAGETGNNIIPFIPEGDFYFTKGVEAFQKRKFDIALKWLGKAVDESPEDPLYLCQMSIIYTEIGSFHAANQLLTKLLHSSKEQYTDCFYLLANNYAHLGLVHDAKKYVQMYLDKEPDGDFSEEARHLLHIIDFDDEEDNDEDDDWDLIEEDELLIYQETVFHHMENMEWDQALPLIEEMMTLFPEHKLAKHDYTQALFFKGNHQEAIQKELENLNEEPNSLYSLTNLAVFYFEMDMEHEYTSYIHALQNIYPIHEQQKLRLAVTFARTKMYQEAVVRFRSLQKGLVKSHPSYFRWYSISCYHTGDDAKALTLWKEGCKRHPKISKGADPWTS